MHSIGIDPGLTGAVAVLPEGLFLDTPTTAIKAGKSKQVYLVARMVAYLQAYRRDAHVYIEDVHAMPGNGAVPSFSFGRGFGLWEGIVAALSIPYTLVAPVTWKKSLMAGMSKDKGASRLRAMQLFPNLADQLQLVKHHGRADALLIAEHGRRQQGG